MFFLNGREIMGAVLAATLLVAVPAFGQGEKEGEPLQFLFIHHSCGGQLLAEPGEQVGGERGSGERCIYVSHPNGGGLRSMLEAEGFAVNEASYESIVGEDTDIHHWYAKFRDMMDRILKTKRQDELLPEGVTNDIVAFKSCYPNNRFVGRGEEPGDPESEELTIANAKAAYRASLEFFARQPDVLFVAFTAPPLAERKPVGMKAKIKALFQKKDKSADMAREFNNWLADRQNGWLSEYDGNNVAVFDYYDVLTKNGETNWSAYPTRGGSDSHPSSEGNGEAARAFMAFIQKAVQDFRVLN